MNPTEPSPSFKNDITASNHSPPNRRFSYLTTASVIAGITLVISVSVWAVRASQEAARIRSTQQSFMLTGWSLEQYDFNCGHLPFPVRRETEGKLTSDCMPNGTGRPLYSWRAECALHRDGWFKGEWHPSSEWNDPANNDFADYPWQFCYDALVNWGTIPKNYSKNTAMMAITGPGTPLGDGNEPPKSLRELDGDTILVVEVRNSGTHWMAPGDLDIRTMPRTINGVDGHGISSRYRGGFHVLFADWRIWFISERVPFEVLEKFFTVDGARQHDAEQQLGPYVLDRFKP